jgi:hypothetical protein
MADNAHRGIQKKRSKATNIYVFDGATILCANNFVQKPFFLCPG